MEVDPASYLRAAEALPPWPTAWTLPPFPPLERADLWELRQGDVTSDRTEWFAATAASAHGALEVAVADGLAAMQRGDRLIRLGYSCLADYAREVLGISERTAQVLARLSRGLETRPLLRAAVRAGKVQVRKAETVLPVAVGDAEAEWVELAKALSVRTLEELVKAKRASLGEDEEEWTRFRVKLSPDERIVLDEALKVAGKVPGMEGSSRAQRLEAMAQEYIAEHAQETPDDESEPSKASFRTRNEARARYEAQLEVETQSWSMLPATRELDVPEGKFDGAATAEEIDVEVRRLATMRASWDDALGHTALAVKDSGMYRTLGFADFAHYCAERLGLRERAAEQRAALEKRLWQVPVLRDALLERQLSYEQTRLLSHLPDAEIPAWIARAQELTCIELRRELDSRREAQLRAANSFAAPVPERIAVTLSAAFRAVRAVEGPCLSDGRCLVALAKHFLETWKPLVKKRRSRSQRIRERDLGRCQVPGCSRRAMHAHHVTWQSHQGSDDDPNLVGLCNVHHLVGIHRGYIRVSGTAPSALVWKLGGRTWAGPERWARPAWKT